MVNDHGHLVNGQWSLVNGTVNAHDASSCSCIIESEALPGGPVLSDVPGTSMSGRGSTNGQAVDSQQNA